MFYYKFTAEVTDEKWRENENDRHDRHEHRRNIACKTADFNEKRRDGRYFFISNADNDSVTGGVISEEPLGTQGAFAGFLKAVLPAVSDIIVNETTFRNIYNMLGRASHSDYIDDDDDEIIERFGLDQLTGRRWHEMDFGETIIADTSADAQDKACDELVANETLGAELERIRAGKSNTKAFGHPVHYMIECDDAETRKGMFGTLLETLYANGRLNSRRYSFIDVRPAQRLSKATYDALYKSCIGGTVIVHYAAQDDSEDDDEYAGGEMATIETLCETMHRYRNEVLTVFCLPRACERTKKSFFENIGAIGVVELREDLADRARAEIYLKHLCKAQHIGHDRKLFAGLENDRTYLPDELRKIFDEWYNNKMKTSVYPQYKEIALCRKEAVKEQPKGSAYDELAEMIGLAEAKAVINKAIGYYKFQHVYKDKGVKCDRAAMHMVFTGNPGTAKTTVARLFARIMKENGLLSRGHLVEVGRGDLVGKYLGWTAPTVKEKFKEAMGGVLFIDEAYSLVDDKHGLYGDEAINTIVQEMENRRDDLVVIFAGYPAEMDRFLAQNPGLRSRIAFHVPFADYDTDDLCGIARLIARSKGVELSDGAIDKLAGVFEEASAQRDFGNGRYVRNVIERSKMNQASRICSLDVDDVTEAILTTIEEQDVEVPKTTAAPRRQTIGFAS